MFALFSANLYRLASEAEYKLATPNADDISTVIHWTMQKLEMATVITLQVIDFSQLSWADALAIDNAHRPWANSLRGKVGQAASVYLLVGGAVPDWQGAEEYFGQDVYSIFWYIDLNSGEISAPKGQPKKLFGLEVMINKAIKGIHHDNPTSIFGKTIMPLQPKYKYPIITGLIIAVNVIILALMYLNGYPGDIWVPRSFGAIYPPWVFEYGQWWRLFTAMFVHFGAAHLAANTFGLLIFGTRVERYFGRVRFCLIYLFAGLLGSVFSIFISQGYAAGASGAVYALVGALFAYTRLTKRSIEFMNWYLMFTYIGIGIAMGFATPGIDNAAHIGGLIGGAVFGAWIGMKERKQ